MKLTKEDICWCKHCDEYITLSRLREVWMEYKRGGYDIDTLFGEILEKTEPILSGGVDDAVV